MAVKLRASALALVLAVSVFVPAAAEASKDQDAQPIRPPQPIYPALAARAGMPGVCVVLFDVDRRGATINIQPHCSHRIFCQSASEAIAGALFSPQTLDGQPTVRFNVVYPLEYQISGSEDELLLLHNMVANDKLKSCVGALTS
jgi:TonB family protein